jgi:uncharacterized membrane protein YoaK (UPF0700 family)
MDTKKKSSAQTKRLATAVAILFSRAKVAGRIATIPNSVQFAAGLVLIVVAGFVDAVCYVELGGFFASFMSGASISLGVSASGQQWTAAYHAAFLIVVFVTAATISTVISGTSRLGGKTIAILLEAVLLSGAVLMIDRGSPSSDAIAPLVAAMGVQNTAFRPINGIRLGVTYMTGTLVTFSQALGSFLIGGARTWTWAAHGLVWMLFVAGAAAGAVLHLKYGFIALAVPTAVVWILVAVMGLAALMAFLKPWDRKLET